MALEEKTAAQTAATVRTAVSARRDTRATLVLVLQKHPLKFDELFPFCSVSEFILCYVMSCFWIEYCLWLLHFEVVELELRI